MMKFRNNKKGMTLLELILYISLVSVVLLAISGLIFSVLQSRVRNQVVSEVEEEGLITIQIISQAIRNAKNINSPSTGSAGASLSLASLDLLKDPTVFDSSGSVIRISEGSGTTVNLTSLSMVAVSNLSFKNLTPAESPGVISFSFVLTHINLSGRREYDYSKTFYGSANLRNY